MKKRLLKEFQHNIPPKRPSSVYQKGVSVLRTVWVSPVGILQQVLQPEQTDVDVHIKKWISTLQFSTVGEALIANNNTNSWSIKENEL